MVVARKDFESDFYCSLNSRNKAAIFLKKKIATWGPSRDLGLTAGQVGVCYHF